MVYCGQDCVSVFTAIYPFLAEKDEHTLYLDIYVRREEIRINF